LRLVHLPIDFVFDGSFRIKLYPDDGVARLTYYFDYHEPEAFGFLERWIEPGMTFFDIGANIGVYALFASKRVGPRGKVVAFEPQAQTFSRFLENIRINEITNITPEPFAVGSIEGYVAMVCDIDSSKSHTRMANLSDHIIYDNPKTYQCECISLDKYLCAHAIERLDYIKIDVEGFEFEVLRGAVQTLERFKPPIIQVELVDEFQRRNGSSPRMVCDFLWRFNYRPFQFDEQSSKIAPLSGSKPRNGDIFFLHESKYCQISEMLQL
jgi:FkbM family methyltransferase